MKRTMNQDRENPPKLENPRLMSKPGFSPKPNFNQFKPQGKTKANKTHISRPQKDESHKIKGLKPH